MKQKNQTFLETFIDLPTWKPIRENNLPGFFLCFPLPSNHILFPPFPSFSTTNQLRRINIYGANDEIRLKTVALKRCPDLYSYD